MYIKLSGLDVKLKGRAIIQNWADVQVVGSLGLLNQMESRDPELIPLCNLLINQSKLVKSQTDITNKNMDVVSFATFCEHSWITYIFTL